jgi:hypothetical protein
MSNPNLTSQGLTNAAPASSGSNSGTPSWGERLATIASLAGAAIAVVAALGFPAAIVQFSRLAVPRQFLTYDRALGAGILPALALVFVVTLLWGVGYVLSQRHQLWAWYRARKWPDLAKMPSPVRIVLSGLYAVVVVPTLLVLFVVFIALVLAMFAAMLIWMSYPFVWEKRVLGLPATIATVAIVVALWIRYYLPYLRSRITRRPSIADLHESTANKSTPEIDASGSEEPFAGLYGGLGFGGWMWAALFTIRWATQPWLGVKLNAMITDARLRTIAVVFGFIVYSVFFSDSSAPAFASVSRIRRRLAWAELTVVGASLYAVFAWQYANEVYPWVPQSLGGGRPEPVILDYNPGTSDTDLGRLLPAASCAREGTDWRCQKAFLVEARGDNWVITDGASPTARSVVVPRSAVILVTGR